MNQNARYLVGVDIGGTFTDIVLLDRSSRHYTVHKLLTSYPDQSIAVVTGIREILAMARVDISRVEYVVHGTTLTANTIIQRTGAETVLFVTEGFEDTLELRNEQRYDVYDLFSKFPVPLVAAPDRIPVRERLLSDGKVLTPLDPDQFRGQLRWIAERAPRSIAICFLHSYANPAHENAAAALVREGFPDVSISVSSEIVPQAGEYARMSTTVANAYVQPVLDRYLRNLDAQLRDTGMKGNLYLMLSDGGTAPVEIARQFPVRLFESGPAAGITATSRLHHDGEYRHLVAFDMGGTTAKICIIDEGQPFMTWDLEVDRAERFASGSGLPLKIPSFEMIEIGAGGGSLAYINELGLLKVGPSSAGSTPGPCCYGRGGTQPTVTDALLVLGYLDPDYFLGGKLTLDTAAAVDAIDREVASLLELTTEDAALGIFRIACGQMAEATRVHIAESGKDPRRYSLVAFGGAGPVHACEVARQLKIPRVIVPPAAGIMSAYGLLMAPLAFSVVQSYPAPLSSVDRTTLKTQLNVLEDRARDLLRGAGVEESAITIQRAFDLKYAGQKHTIEVSLPRDVFDAEFEIALLEEFERLYASQHGRVNRGMNLYLESIKVRGLGPAEASAALSRPAESEGVATSIPRRTVRYLGIQERIQVPILKRGELSAGERYDGPAIVQEPETTTIVGPQDQFEIDEQNNLVVHIGAMSNSESSTQSQEAYVGFHH